MNAGWFRSELTYCTNVHPGAELDQVSALIDGPLGTVRQRRKLSAMTAGLWINHTTADQLGNPEAVDEFAARLSANSLSLQTLNGFPAHDFHAREVKQAVYQPDWSQAERLQYTIKLAHILADILPNDASEGSISTVPLGFTAQWNGDKQERALAALLVCLHELENIHRQTAKSIRLCLEMEPGCVLQETPRLVHFFTSELADYLAAHDADNRLVDRYLGICFDVCHQAVMFEDCYDSLRQIHDAGIRIGKIQVSSALQLADPENNRAYASLKDFIEPRFLHQACYQDSSGLLHQAMDLDQAFAEFPRTSPWRIHFHVPIQATSLISDGLTTTQHAIGRTLDFLADHPRLHPHLEVETYTWSALPREIRPDSADMLIDGLAREILWLEAQMQQRKLLREDTP